MCKEDIEESVNDFFKEFDKQYAEKFKYFIDFELNKSKINIIEGGLNDIQIEIKLKEKPKPSDNIIIERNIKSKYNKNNNTLF